MIVRSKKEIIRNMLMVILGSATFSLGFDLFLDPNGITCGGVSGIAQLVIYSIDQPVITIGVLSALINVPLFLLGYKNIGKYFFFSSLLGMVVTSVCFDLFAAVIPVPEVDPLLAAIFGGVIIGAGLGLVFLAGASTGGTDILARLMKLKLRNFPIGKLLLGMDLCIAAALGFVYGEFTSVLYSIVALYLCSVVLDKVVYGMDFAKVALIITEKHEEISAAICDKLDRGVTLLRGMGYYVREDKLVVLSAVKRQQLAELKELVMEIDPKAFIILQDAHQVLGDGFKRYDRNEL